MKRIDVLLLFAALVALSVGVGCNYNPERVPEMDIWDAVEREDLDAIASYVANGGDLEIGASSIGKTPLLHAFLLRKKSSFSKLLELEANPNTECKGGGDIHIAGATIVHHAAACEDTFWLKAALEAGGDPNRVANAKGLQKSPPLGYAISGIESRIENVKILCDFGADVNANVDAYGTTVLSLAIGGAKYEIVLILLERGAEPGAGGDGDAETFIQYILLKDPETYQHFRPEVNAQILAIWEWLRTHGKDPKQAKWDGTKWVW